MQRWLPACRVPRSQRRCRRLKFYTKTDERGGKGRTMVLSRNRRQTRFVVLPPTSVVAISGQFLNVEVDSRRHHELFAEMQRFRGSVYLSDGAIRSADLTDGRHKVCIDEHSWHVLSIDSSGRICACLRFLEERNASGFDDMFVRHAALSECPKFGSRFRGAVETEMERARQM